MPLRTRAVKTLEDARKQLQRLAQSVNDGAVTAGDIANVPAGNIAATDVQSAINELDSEKVAKALYDANTILAANSDNTPAALPVAEQRIVGRITGGSIDDLTLTQVLDMAGSAAEGDILYRGASTWSRLAKGTNGQLLGIGASAPEWVNAIARAVNDFRLTLESGVAVSTTDQSAKTTVYACPKSGGASTEGQIALYDGSRWVIRATAQLSIGTTTTRNGTTANTSTVITGLSTTVDLVIGQEVTGTGIAASSVIASIDSATQVTLNNAATASGTVSLTFKCPASSSFSSTPTYKVYDLFIVDISGTPTLVFGPIWTNGTTRATALTQKDGVFVLTGSFSVAGTSYAEGRLRHVGTIAITETAGQTADADATKFVWSRDNRVYRSCRHIAGDAHTYTTGAWREFNNTTHRCHFVIGSNDERIDYVVDGELHPDDGYWLYAGFGIDTVTAGMGYFSNYNAQLVRCINSQCLSTAAGAHYVAAVEYGNTGGTFNLAVVSARYRC